MHPARRTCPCATRAALCTPIAAPAAPRAPRPAAAVLGALLSLGACAPAPKGAADADGQPTDSGGGVDSGGAALGAPEAPAGRLKIEELFYSGSPGPEGEHLHTFSDQFTDLRNDSDAPVLLDGLCIGDALGPAGEINPGTLPSTLADRYPDAAVLGNVWCLPAADAGRTLEPGQTLLIVQDGLNHQPLSPFDHSGADYETHNQRADEGDEDSPTVTNLDRVLFTGGYDWLITVFGPSVVIFVQPADEPLTTARIAGADAALVPLAWVVDAVNAVMDADSLDYRRLPPTLDAGAGWVSGTYTGESLRRRADAEGKLQDTDDSGADLVVEAAPQPGR
jgi:hypothetical protein